MTEKMQLRFLDGEEVPEKLLKDILIFKNLSKNARENIWDLINTFSQNEIDDKNALIDKYAKKTGVKDNDNLEAALNVLIFIVRNAYFKDLSAQMLSQDLFALGLSEPDIATLLSEYENNRKEYRKTAMIQTMGDHGSLFLGSSWRVSHIQSSDRGRNLNFPIIDLTFTYLKDGGKSNFSISLTPQNALDLKQKLDEILNIFSTDVIKIKNTK